MTLQLDFFSGPVLAVNTEDTELQNVLERRQAVDGSHHDVMAPP